MLKACAGGSVWAGGSDMSDCVVRGYLEYIILLGGLVEDWSESRSAVRKVVCGKCGRTAGEICYAG